MTGVSRQFRKLRNNKSKQLIIDHKKSGFKVLEPPKNFCLIENTEESLGFIAKMSVCFERKDKVFVDMYGVENIANGAIVVMLSILVKFKANKIIFNGNFPKNKRVKTHLNNSGFFKYLLLEDIQMQDDYSFEYGICTHADKDVEPILTDSIIKRASKFIWQEERTCTGLQRVFVELMQNSHNHASLEKQGDRHWWLTTDCLEDKKKVCFSFIDYGVGILESLKRKPEGQRFHGIIPKIIKIFNPTSNAELLKLLLNGKIHEIVDYSKHRGKGLPGIFNALQNNKISNLVIISNDAMADCVNDNYKCLENKLSGTFVYWELNFENDNKKGEQI